MAGVSTMASKAVLQRVLADPEFVYRREAEAHRSVRGQELYHISADLAMASRLSFFLWSTVPDEELLDVATQGKLKDPAMLEKEVRRMLADPKSKSLVANFTGQWLGVRSLKTAEPVVNLFPDFDDNLRAAYQREIELFFGSIVYEDRSVMDLLTANYTFVNERLAKQYGIPNIYGPAVPSRVERCPPELDMRRGLLGKMGALLTLTSNAARTSPVARGNVVPRDIPRFPAPGPAAERTWVIRGQSPGCDRQREAADDARDHGAAHHTNPSCASCHKIFEPIGLSLETGELRKMRSGHGARWMATARSTRAACWWMERRSTVLRPCVIRW